MPGVVGAGVVGATYAVVASVSIDRWMDGWIVGGNQKQRQNKNQHKRLVTRFEIDETERAGGSRADSFVQAARADLCGFTVDLVV